jgi:iron(III) transport system substrate-binding protein
MNGLRRFQICLFSLAALALFACDAAPPAPASAASDAGSNTPAKDTGPLTVYCGRNEKLVAPVIAAFTAETGIKVSPKYGKTQQLATQIVKEGKKSPADVFLAQDASTLAYLDGKGAFAPLSAETLGVVDARHHGPNKTWIGTTGRARVLVYDSGKLTPEQLPKSVDDLTDPKWKGKVGWAPENASFKSFIAAMIQLRGAEATQRWLEQMRDNEPRAYPKNTPAVRAVHKGEVLVALVNHYYLFRIADEVGETKVKNFYFRNGQAEAMVNLTGAAVMKTSTRRADAERFVAFLAGPVAQEHFANKVHEFPVRQETTAAGLPDLETLNAPELDIAALGNLEETERLLRASRVSP